MREESESDARYKIFTSAENYEKELRENASIVTPKRFLDQPRAFSSRLSIKSVLGNHSIDAR